MEKQKKNLGSVAFLPLIVFLVCYVGCGITFTLMGADDPFGKFPRHVALLAGCAVALLLNRSIDVKDKLNIMTTNMGNSGVMMIVLIYLMAGGFQGAAAAMGGKDSVVNLCLHVIPVTFLIPGVFLMCCFISTSIGTSMGTIAAMAPIAINVAQGAHLNVAIVGAAVIGGSYFGDNLSMISDTTISAAEGCGSEMKDKFKANFFIVLPAAIITVLIFWFATRNMNFHLEENLSYSLWEVLPYMVVLIGALIGINVFVVLISGIVISLIVGVSMGHIALSEMFQVVGNGVTSMYDITVISIIVACIVSLVKEHGGIQFILNLIKSKINGRRGAEFGIALLAFFVDACTANNTVAIVMTGPIAKEISEEFDVDPRRSASLLDMFTSVGQGIIPYGAQLLSAATLTGLTPLQIIPNLYYPLLMGVCGVLAIIFRPQSKKLQ